MPGKRTHSRLRVGRRFARKSPHVIRSLSESARPRLGPRAARRPRRSAARAMPSCSSGAARGWAGSGFLVARRGPGSAPRWRARHAPPAGAATGRMDAARGRRGELGGRLHRLDGALRAPGRASIPLYRGPLWLPFYLLMLGGPGEPHARRAPARLAGGLARRADPRLRRERGHKPAADAACLDGRANPGPAGRAARVSRARRVLIVAIVLVLALRRWEPDPRWGLWRSRCSARALGDLVWSYLVASGSARGRLACRSPLRAHCGAIAWAAWAPRRIRSPAATTTGYTASRRWRPAAR